MSDGRAVVDRCFRCSLSVINQHVLIIVSGANVSGRFPGCRLTVDELLSVAGDIGVVRLVESRPRFAQRSRPLLSSIRSFSFPADVLDARLAAACDKC